MTFGPSSVYSAEGTQQGDPLGALLFCLAVHPLIEDLNSELVFGYLDDLTLGGNQSTVASDVNKIIDRGGKMGLVLNVAKSELLLPNGSTVNTPALSSFTRVEPQNITLLGAP